MGQTRLDDPCTHDSTDIESHMNTVMVQSGVVPDFLSLLQVAEHRDRLRANQGHRVPGTRMMRRSSSLSMNIAHGSKLLPPAASSTRKSRAGSRTPFTCAVRSRRAE